VPQWEPAADLDDAMSKLIDPEFPGRSVCVVTDRGNDHETLAVLLPSGASDSGDAIVADARCALVREAPEELEITTDTTSGGILVLADTFAGGWHAYVDGARSPILQVNGLFRGVYLPSGKHTVVFTYAPLSVTLGFLITGLAVLGCAGWVAFTGSRQLLALLPRRAASERPVVTPTDFSGEKKA
jgi:hypothetical protein